MSIVGGVVCGELEVVDAVVIEIKISYRTNTLVSGGVYDLGLSRRGKDHSQACCAGRECIHPELVMN
jgi:hypothetical protein